MAWLLTRYRFPGRPLLNALVHLPLVLPPVVTGWLLLILFGIRGPIGSLLLSTGSVSAWCSPPRAPASPAP